MTPPLLHLHNLQKSYQHPAGSIVVLNGVNAEVNAGETVAILGPSGSGKSTLLSLLAGLDRPSAGHIKLLGDDIGKMPEKQLATFRARHLGIVFQQFHLMSHLSARENVALPLKIAGKRDAADKAAEALAAVGLGHRMAHFPHELSGGECQRVAIARALIGRPPLILADEPSGNLDTKTGEQVMRLLFNLVREHKSTLILVTHNEDLSRWCDRRLTLQQGTLLNA